MVERCERCVSGLGLGFLKIVAAAVVRLSTFIFLECNGGKVCLKNRCLGFFHAPTFS